MHLRIDDLKNISSKVFYALLIILFASWSVLIFFARSNGKLVSGLLSLSFLLLISSKFEWGDNTSEDIHSPYTYYHFQFRIL